MCTELFLAMIYFFTIAIINLFLYKLLKNYLINIIKQQKIKNIFAKCSAEKQVFPILYSYFEQNNKKTDILQRLNFSKNIKDFLIIGNTYKFLGRYSSQNKFFDDLYFLLLENQCLKQN